MILLGWPLLTGEVDCSSSTISRVMVVWFPNRFSRHRKISSDELYVDRRRSLATFLLKFLHLFGAGWFTLLLQSLPFFPPSVVVSLVAGKLCWVSGFQLYRCHWG